MPTNSIRPPKIAILRKLAQLEPATQLYNLLNEILRRLRALEATASTRLIPRRTEATGNGIQLTFDLDFANTLGCTVFVDGVIQPTNVYSVAAGAGAGGVDQLQFTSGNAPANESPVDVEYFTRR